MAMIRDAAPRILQCIPTRDLSHRDNNGRAFGNRNKEFETQVCIDCGQHYLGQNLLTLMSMSILDFDVFVGRRHGVLPARN